MDKCPKCGQPEYRVDGLPDDKQPGIYYCSRSIHDTDGYNQHCHERELENKVRELTAEVQRLREAGREVVCVISRCSCEKCADLARRRWQEVDPR